MLVTVGAAINDVAPAPVLYGICRFVPAAILVVVVADVAVAALPVVLWLKVGQVNVPVLKLPDCGVPKIGVVKLGEVAKATTVPLPVVLYEVPHAVPVELAIPAEGYVALAPGTHAVPFQIMACPLVGVPVT